MESTGTSPADSLAEEHKAVRLLTQLLQQEQAQLIAANVDALADLTDEKARLATHMTSLAKARHRALAAAGFEAHEAGMRAWVESPAGAAVSASWNELLSLADAAKEINRINGTLIGSQMARNEAMLNILEHGSVQVGAVYGPDGQTARKGVGRRLEIG